MNSLFSIAFLLAVYSVLIPSLSLAASPRTEPVQGLRNNTPNVHAFINVRIVPRPGEVIEQGTLVVRDGVIESIGESTDIPADARVWDQSGMTVYPGLIESYTHAGVKDTLTDSPEGKYWNIHVRPERTLQDYFDPEDSDLPELRKLGFTSAHIVPDTGIFRGQSALISLADTDLQNRLIRDRIAQHIALERQRGDSRESYPNSLMGVIALVRQVGYDAQWYGKAHDRYAQYPQQEKPEYNQSLQALQKAYHTKQPVMFSVPDEQRFLRALAIASEFDLLAWYQGTGYEYRNPAWYGNIQSPMPVPLNFPKTPWVKTHEESLDIRLTALRHWERAPSNPAVLAREFIPFTLSTHSNKISGFPDSIRKAQKSELSDDDLLASLTTVPAQMLGVAGELGTLEKGKRGHFILVDGNLFTKESKVMDVWIDGNRYAIHEQQKTDPRGTWKLLLPEEDIEVSSATMEIQGDLPKVSGSLIVEATNEKLKWIELDDDRLSFNAVSEWFADEGVYLFSGLVSGNKINGYGKTPRGKSFTWTASRVIALKEDDRKEGREAVDSPNEFISRTVYPPAAYGRQAPPEQPDVIFIQNATVWTSGAQGVIDNGDVLIVKGTIQRVGGDLIPPENAFIINGEGKHVTPGLIDAHSHIAIESGVNESGQAITTEVRIQDVIDAHDVNIYRQLAGGLTTSHLLHGSANPMGGQSAVIKLKWGSRYDELFETRAPGTVKFALGENVKQSNWGDRFTSRYPQTRMGVEQIMLDRFLAAIDYQQDWDTFNRNPYRRGAIPPRKDLELDALVEILNQKRWIHCHSYRQDEILMLMRLGERLGFRVGTFQHILEGYKVAEVMAKHGAAGSSFSDWWAYKFEVYDAIPYNGALMYEQGVTVSFNSDDAELARRMNTEAAKAVKYGGVPEVEALKFVTLNPAVQLKIDTFTGSLDTGKDADFVIWSGHPLSTYSRCEQTWIEGRKYFDLKDDALLRIQIKDERAALIQKILNDGKSGKQAEEQDSKNEEEWSAEDEAFWFESLQPYINQCGVCGCGIEHQGIERQSIEYQQEELSRFQQQLLDLRRTLDENN